MVTVWWDVLPYTLRGFSTIPVPIYQTAQCHITGDSKSEKLDVHESMHRDTTMKITNKMHYID